MTNTPAGIYISIPFCRQKCTYCNFASDVQPASTLNRYLEMLKKEISSQKKIVADTIYFGGGTPGMLERSQLKGILDTVRSSFSIEEPAEVTLEASPENVTTESAEGWASCGVNRVSFGVQSMVEKEIRAVGRTHTTETVSTAFRELRAAGIHNINVDLIAGLPHQTEESWKQSIDQLLAFAPTHFSVYMLEVDDDSRLGRELLKKGSRYHAGAVPTEEQVADFFLIAMDLLRSAGFEHYEISNFALPGKRSRHNLKYWSDAPYYGFGSEAHSYDGESRWANADLLTEYLRLMEVGRSSIVDQHQLGSSEKIEERIFLGLRCRDGLNIDEINAEFRTAVHNNGKSVGLNIRNKYADSIRNFREAGWLMQNDDRLQLTDSGVLFSNEVFAGFLEGD